MLPQLFKLTLACTAILVPVSFAQDQTELDYAAYASAFREAHGAPNATPGSLPLQSLLNTEAYRKFTLGAFDLRIPAEALQDRELAKNFVLAATAALDAQQHWVDWVGFNHEEYPTIAEDFETLHKWVKGWSTSSLASIGRFPDRDVLESLGAKDAVLEAHGRVEQFMCRGEYLGILRGDAPDTQILFAPNRTWMLQLLCYTGWNLIDNRANYWQSGIEKWTSFWNEETQVIALEYPAYPFDWKRPERGADMNEYEKTGLGQHTAEKVTTSLFWRYFGNNDALFYEAALGVNAAISIYEENNVRTGAPVFKNSGGSSSPFSVFVPGGNPSGGTLPGRGAVSIITVPLWRETKGEDHYVKPLGKAQKKGKKLASKDKHPSKDSRAHFIVFGKKANDTSYVTAPFFGPDAEGKELPGDEYLVDYEEFFRAYSASFFHWLRTRGAGKDEEQCAALFSDLNQRLATRDKSTGFATVVEEVYGLPLSAPDGETDSLEWRFLTFISKGGR